jgi:hypothetical protein
MGDEFQSGEMCDTSFVVVVGNDMFLGATNNLCLLLLLATTRFLLLLVGVLLNALVDKEMVVCGKHIGRLWKFLECKRRYDGCKMEASFTSLFVCLGVKNGTRTDLSYTTKVSSLGEMPGSSQAGSSLFIRYD